MECEKPSINFIKTFIISVEAFKDIPFWKENNISPEKGHQDATQNYWEVFPSNEIVS